MDKTNDLIEVRLMIDCCGKNRLRPKEKTMTTSVIERLRHLSFLLVLLIILCFPVAVHAAGQAILNVSAPDRVERGDELVVTLRVRQSTYADEGEVILSYDSDSFEYLGVTAERYDSADIVGAYEDNGLIGFRISGVLPAGVNEIGKVNLRARGAPGGRVQIQAASFMAKGEDLYAEFGGAYRFVQIQGDVEPLPTTAYTIPEPTQSDGSPTTLETERLDEGLPGVIRTEVTHSTAADESETEIDESTGELSFTNVLRTDRTDHPKMPRRMVVTLLLMFALLFVILMIFFLLLQIPPGMKVRRAKSAKGTSRPGAKRKTGKKEKNMAGPRPSGRSGNGSAGHARRPKK